MSKNMKSRIDRDDIEIGKVPLNRTKTIQIQIEEEEEGQAKEHVMSPALRNQEVDATIISARGETKKIVRQTKKAPPK